MNPPSLPSIARVQGSPARKVREDPDLNATRHDKSFVGDIDREESDVEIPRTRVSPGRALNIKALVEGVETAGQLKLLQAENCTEFQDYLFSKPCSLNATNALVRSSMAECRVARSGAEAPCAAQAPGLTAA